QNDVNTIYYAALKTQPDIKSYEYRVTSADKGISIARSGSYPRLSIGGGLSTNYSSAQQDVVDYMFGNPEITGYTSSFDTVYTFSFLPILKKRSFNDQLNDNLSKSYGFSLT